MTPTSRCAFLLAVFLATVLAGPRPASAVSCGDTLTTSVVLTEDLVCSGHGLFVRGDDVTVDLAGHTISGPGGFLGIDSRGVERTTVLGPGAVAGFAIAIDIEGGSGHLVRGVRAKGRLQALRLVDVTGSTVLGNYAGAVGPEAGTGIWLLGTETIDNEVLYNDVEGYPVGITVQRGAFNLVAENFLRTGVGIALLGANDNVVRDNTIHPVSQGVWIREAADEPAVTADRNRVLRNRIFDPFHAGVLLDHNPSGQRNRGNVVAGNVARGGQRGVLVEATNRGTRVRNNVLFDHTVIPIDDRGVATTITDNVCWPIGC